MQSHASLFASSVPPVTATPQVVLVLIGIPGSGKTTMANELMQGNSMIQWINQDTMGDRKACEKAFSLALQSGVSVIVDRCNFNSQQRGTWTRMARESQRPVKLIAAQLLIDLDVCIQRVYSRQDHPTLDGKTGERVCRQFFKEFELVGPGEGFDEVHTARNPSDVKIMTEILIRHSRPSSLVPYPPAPPPSGSIFADPASGPYDSDCSAPILLFDLNGTLTSLTDQRRSKRQTRLRPGIQRLMDLKNAGFKLGIYTSAMGKTANEAYLMIKAACGDISPFEPGLILHRDHTRPSPQDDDNKTDDPSLKRQRRNHDTVKPLSPYFSKLNKVILIDDDAHKSCQGEERNLILVPAWDDDEEANCTTLSLLVDALLDVDGGFVQANDVREHTARIRDRVQKSEEVEAETYNET